jgi:hypothetical protein
MSGDSRPIRRAPQEQAADPGLPYVALNAGVLTENFAKKPIHNYVKCVNI